MSNKKFIVGLTGGIGSGKSEVCSRFNALGISIVDADIIAREVVEPGSPALDEIHAHFGDGILLASTDSPASTLNRPQLRELIFANPLEKTWLEWRLHTSIY